MIGLPARVRLPTGDREAHRTPDGFETTLSEEGRANLEAWYAGDLAFVRTSRAMARALRLRGGVTPHAVRA
jgi:hypothetical protein